MPGANKIFASYFEDDFLYILGTVASFGIATDCFIASWFFSSSVISSPALLFLMAFSAFTLNLLLYQADSHQELKTIYKAIVAPESNGKKTTLAAIVAILAGLAMGLFAYGIYLNFALHFPLWIMIVFSCCYALGTATLLFSSIKSKLIDDNEDTTNNNDNVGHKKDDTLTKSNIAKYLLIASIIFISLTWYNQPNLLPTYVFPLLIAICTISVIAIIIKINENNLSPPQIKPYIAFALSLLALFSFTNYKDIGALLHITMNQTSANLLSAALLILVALTLQSSSKAESKNILPEYLSLLFITATITLSYTWFDQGVFAIQSIAPGTSPLAAAIIMAVFVVALTSCEIIFCLDQSAKISASIDKTKKQPALLAFIFGIFIISNTGANSIISADTFTKKFSNLMALLTNGILSPITMCNNLNEYDKELSDENPVSIPTKTFSLLCITTLVSIALFSMNIVQLSTTSILLAVFINILISLLYYQAVTNITYFKTLVKTNPLLTTNVQIVLNAIPTLPSCSENENKVALKTA